MVRCYGHGHIMTCEYEPLDGRWVCKFCGDVRLKQVRRNCPIYEIDDAGEGMPPIHRQAWNLATSLAAFVSDGLRFVDADEYAARLAACEACDRRRGRRCLECGCRIDMKARGRAFRCPLGKWPISSPRPA